MKASVQFGISSPILDNGIGFQIGINPTYQLPEHEYVGLEGQISYNYTGITSSFISGRKGSAQAFHLLGGGRIYLFPESWNTRMYLNLMAGLLVYTATLDNTQGNLEYGLGLSTGLYVKHKRIIIGISGETPQNVMAKVGFIF